MKEKRDLLNKGKAHNRKAQPSSTPASYCHGGTWHLRAGGAADFPSSESHSPENTFNSPLLNVTKCGGVAGPWRSGDHDKETQPQQRRQQEGSGCSPGCQATSSV